MVPCEHHPEGFIFLKQNYSPDNHGVVMVEPRKFMAEWHKISPDQAISTTHERTMEFAQRSLLQTSVLRPMGMGDFNCWRRESGTLVAAFSNGIHRTTNMCDLAVPFMPIEVSSGQEVENLIQLAANPDFYDATPAPDTNPTIERSVPRQHKLGTLS